MRVCCLLMAVTEQVTFRGWATCCPQSCMWWRVRWMPSGVLLPTWTRWWVHKNDMMSSVLFSSVIVSLYSSGNKVSYSEVQQARVISVHPVASAMLYSCVFVFAAPELWGADAGDEDSAAPARCSAQTIWPGLLELPWYEILQQYKSVEEDCVWSCGTMKSLLLTYSVSVAHNDINCPN